MDALGAIRSRHEAGVLAYFLRRTGSVELAWDLAAETWGAAEIAAGRARPGGGLPDGWLFAVARETLCQSLRAQRVSDRARRKTGVGDDVLTPAGAEWVREVATDDRLAELVAGLPPAMREAVMAPVPARDAAALAARLRVRRPAPAASTPARERRFVPRFRVAPR